MPYTTLSDVWVPEVFASYQNNASIESTDFVKSGIVVANAAFNSLAEGAGNITTMPFWNPLDASTEPNYSNDVYTDIAEPQKVTAGEMQARVSDLNEGWNSPDLVTQLSGKDPLKFVAATVDTYWEEQFQRRVIATAIGIYNDNVAANSGDMVNDISSANMTVAAGNQLSASAVITAVMTMGDKFKNISTIAMHSVIFSGLAQLDQIVYEKPSGQSIDIPTYLGKKVIIDDGLPIIGGDGSTVAYKYLTILFGQGAFGFGRGTPKVPFEMQREANRANGGGTETLWVRKRWIIHPAGFTFTSNTITGPGLSPTWADLKLAANWTRILSRKNIPLAFIVSNA